MKRLFASIAGLIFALSVTPTFATEPLAKVEGMIPKTLENELERVLGSVDENPRSMAQARRRGQKAKETAISVLRSNGYYGARVTVSIPRPKGTEATKAVSRRPVLMIEPGPQFKFGAVEIVYEGQTPEQARKIKSELDIKPDTPALASQVVTSEAQIIGALRQVGYPESEALKRKAVVDHAVKTLVVTFNIKTGDQTRFGNIQLLGDAKISKAWVEKNSPIETGAIVDTAKLNLFSSRIIATQAFAGASSTLAKERQTNADGTVTRDVLLDVNSGKRNTISMELGISTTDGVGIDAVYTRRNLGKKGQVLKIPVTAKTNLLSLGADYHIPYFGSPERSLNLGAEIAREDTDAFEGERITTNALISQTTSEYLKVIAGLGFEASQFDEGGVETRALLINGLGTAIYDRRNSVLDSTKGYELTASVIPTYNFGEDDGVFANAESSASVYQRVSESLVLAGRVKGATVIGAPLDSVPLNRRLYAGGGGSVRGFGFQSISPVDVNDDLVGGRSLAEASAEIRYRGKSPFGFAAFVDAGSVSSSGAPDFEEVLYGAGVGLRYFTSFAPIRADIAVPINRRDGDNSFQVYISIGQAF